MEFTTDPTAPPSTLASFHVFEMQHLKMQIQQLEHERDTARAEARRFQEALVAMSRLLLAAAGKS